MKTEKIATLTLEIAKQMFVSNVESLKQFALHHYTEEELTKKEFPKEYKKQFTVWSFGYCNTKENAKAFAALGKLIAMRDLWWEIDGNWKPDWNANADKKFTIRVKCNELEEGFSISTNKTFTFRTEEIRDEFLETFRESLEICKSLI